MEGRMCEVLKIRLQMKTCGLHLAIARYNPWPPLILLRQEAGLIRGDQHIVGSFPSHIHRNRF